MILRHLGYWSLAAPIDGTTSLLLSAALLSFQNAYNETLATADADMQPGLFLPVTGTLSPATLHALRRRMEFAVKLLAQAGYPFVGSPTNPAHKDAFQAHLAELQRTEKIRVTVAGALNGATWTWLSKTTGVSLLDAQG